MHLLIALIVFGTGCASQPGVSGDTLGTPAGETEVVFPHSASWLSAAIHGTFVNRNGTAVCLKCHDPDETKGNVTACHSCHELFPHATGWALKENHGLVALKDTGERCATSCHGSDLTGGLSGIRCTNCHDVYPHPEGWAGGDQHGLLAKGEGQTYCKGCHGSDLSGGETGVGCRQCHEDYPHAAAWKELGHREAAVKKGKESCGGLCHGTDLKGGLSGVSCFQCHESYPHQEGWSTGGHGEAVRTAGSTAACEGCHGPETCYSCHASYPHAGVSDRWKSYEGHGQYVLQQNSKEECRTCHGADLSGGKNGEPSCTSCHASYPHAENWYEAGAPEQAHGLFVQSDATTGCATSHCHGENLQPVAGTTQGPGCVSCHETYPHAESWISGLVHGPVAKADINPCRNCHGAGLDEAPDGSETCASCHPSLIRHETGGGTGWGGFEGHGAYALTNGKQECQKCHGSDLKGGVLVNPSCTACHASYPHDEGWSQAKTHGAFVEKNGTSGCATSRCHGEGLQPVPGVTQGPGCTACHEDYPHGADWKGGLVHGTEALENLDECRSCHGQDLDRAPEGSGSCKDCHASYGKHESAGGDGWKIFDGHGNFTLQNGKLECQKCHGDDYQGGVSGKSCNTCHVSYPHGTGWLMPEGETQGHGLYAESSGSGSCATSRCHGAGLVPEAGVTQGPGCASCHEAYPHAADWEEGTIHGPVALADIGKCKSCHGTNLDQAPAGSKSCVNCHASYVQHESAGVSPTDWTTSGGHGSYAMAHDKAECQICHGENYAGGIANKPCATCHASYPHTDPGWPSDEGHPDYVKDELGQDYSSCQLCHGADLNGGNSQVSCNACHASHEHDDENWTALGKESVHAKVFVAEIQSGNGKACMVCHGENYDQTIGDANCSDTQCHPDGVTHRPGWTEGPGHGAAYSKDYDSQQYYFGTSKCSHCHDGPVIFENDNTREELASKSLCYSCHWAYPHRGYMMTTGPWWWNWVPVSGGDNDYAHRSYLGGTSVVNGVKQSALFMDENGVQPPEAPCPVPAYMLGDPFNIACDIVDNYDFKPALRNTCGGDTPGNCHYNGYRSITPRYGGGLRGKLLCASYCHNY